MLLITGNHFVLRLLPLHSKTAVLLITGNHFVLRLLPLHSKTAVCSIHIQHSTSHVTFAAICGDISSVALYAEWREIEILCNMEFLLTDFHGRWVRMVLYRGLTNIYRVSHELRSLLRESVPYVKIYRYNPKHLCPKLNGYGDNEKRKVWTSWGCTH